MHSLDLVLFNTPAPGSCTLIHQGKQWGGAVQINSGANSLSAHSGQTKKRLRGDDRLEIYAESSSTFIVG
jgi:hypothetical protein